MGLQVGDLSAKVRLDYSGLGNDLGNIKGQFGDAVDEISNKFGEARVAVGAFGLATAGALASTIAPIENYGKTVERLSVVTGMTTENTSRLIAGFGGAGISADQAGSMMQRLEFRLGAISAAHTKARAAGKDQADMLQKMGVETLDASGHMKSMNTLLPEIIDKMGKMTDSGERARLATQLFGRSWTQLAPLMAAGGDAFVKAMGNADRFGTTMSEAQVKQIHELDVAKTQLGEAFLGLQLSIGSGLIPIITQFVTKITDIVAAFQHLSPETKKIIEDVLKMGAVFGTLIGGTSAIRSGLGILANFLPGVGGLLQSVGEKFLFVLGPIGLIAAAILGLKQAFDHIPAFHEALKPLVDLFGAAGITTQGFLGHLKDLGTWIESNFLQTLSKFGNWFASNALAPFVRWLIADFFPALGQLEKWFSEHISKAIESVGHWFSTTGMEAFNGFSRWLNNDFFPVLGQLWKWFSDHIMPALFQFSDWFISQGIPAVGQFASWIATYLVPPLYDLARTLVQVAGVLVTSLAPVLFSIAMTIGPPIVAVFKFLGEHMWIVEAAAGAVALRFAAIKAIDLYGWAVNAAGGVASLIEKLGQVSIGSIGQSLIGQGSITGGGSTAQSTIESTLSNSLPSPTLSLNSGRAIAKEAEQEESRIASLTKLTIADILSSIAMSFRFFVSTTKDAVVLFGQMLAEVGKAVDWAFGSPIEKTLNGIGSLWNTAMDGIKSGAQAVGNFVKNIWADLSTSVRAAINGISVEQQVQADAQKALARDAWSEQKNINQTSAMMNRTMTAEQKAAYIAETEAQLAADAERATSGGAAATARTVAVRAEVVAFGEADAAEVAEGGVADGARAASGAATAAARGGFMGGALPLGGIGGVVGAIGAGAVLGTVVSGAMGNGPLAGAMGTITADMGNEKNAYANISYDANGNPVDAATASANGAQVYQQQLQQFRSGGGAGGAMSTIGTTGGVFGAGGFSSDQKKSLENAVSNGGDEMAMQIQKLAKMGDLEGALELANRFAASGNNVAKTWKDALTSANGDVRQMAGEATNNTNAMLDATTRKAHDAFQKMGDDSSNTTERQISNAQSMKEELTASYMRAGMSADAAAKKADDFVKKNNPDAYGAFKKFEALRGQLHLTDTEFDVLNRTGKLALGGLTGSAAQLTDKNWLVTQGVKGIALAYPGISAAGSRALQEVINKQGNLNGVVVNSQGEITKLPKSFTDSLGVGSNTQKAIDFANGKVLGLNTNISLLDKINLSNLANSLRSIATDAMNDQGLLGGVLRTIIPGHKTGGEGGIVTEEGMWRLGERGEREWVIPQHKARGLDGLLDSLVTGHGTGGMSSGPAPSGGGSHGRSISNTVNLYGSDLKPHDVSREISWHMKTAR